MSDVAKGRHAFDEGSPTLGHATCCCAALRAMLSDFIRNAWLLAAKGSLLLTWPECSLWRHYSPVSELFNSVCLQHLGAAPTGRPLVGGTPHVFQVLPRQAG